MCGIFGYYNFNVPRDRAAILQLLIGGLRRLEYRGYDSAGICIDSKGVVAHSSPANGENSDRKFWLNWWFDLCSLLLRVFNLVRAEYVLYTLQKAEDGLNVPRESHLIGGIVPDCMPFQWWRCWALQLNSLIMQNFGEVLFFSVQRGCDV